jgi:uncharacterized protein
MPGGASKLRDIRKLADAGATFELDIPVAELPGLPLGSLPGEGEVQAQLRFGHEQGFMAAHVALRAELPLICQRCMGSMRARIETDSAVLLLESEADAERAPVEWETYLAADGRLSFAALVAEELLLALPIVPLHADAAVCAGQSEEAGAVAGVRASQAVEQEGAVAATVRPFADLRSLLEGAKPKT